MKMDEENLVSLTLDLEIPNLWENSLVRAFPNSRFIIKSGSPLGDDSFSGLLKVENGDFDEISSFLEENYPLVSIEFFDSRMGIYYYMAPDYIVPKILKNTHGVFSWPVEFLNENKRIRLILKEGEIDFVMGILESEGINVVKFSKVRVDFTLKEILTPKQKEILGPSIKYGYYQFPKRISLNELSRKIGVSPSTLCVHLQKIESKIMGSSGVDLFL